LNRAEFRPGRVSAWGFSRVCAGERNRRGPCAIHRFDGWPGPTACRAPQETTRSGARFSVEGRRNRPIQPLQQQRPWRGRSGRAQGVWASGVDRCSLRRHQGLSLCSKGLTFLSFTDLVEPQRRDRDPAGRGSTASSLCTGSRGAEPFQHGPKPAQRARPALLSTPGHLIDSARGPCADRLGYGPEWRHQIFQKHLQGIELSGLSVAHYREEGTQRSACALPRFGGCPGEVLPVMRAGRDRTPGVKLKPATG